MYATQNQTCQLRLVRTTQLGHDWSMLDRLDLYLPLDRDKPKLVVIFVGLIGIKHVALY
jgi:hypothetical protein